MFELSDIFSTLILYMYVHYVKYVFIYFIYFFFEDRSSNISITKMKDLHPYTFVS